MLGFKVSPLVLQHFEQMMHCWNQIQKTKELNSASDICMRLRLEKPLVFGSGGERRCGLNDDGGVRRPRNGQIRQKIKAGRGKPVFGCVIRSSLKEQQVVFSSILPGHGNEGFMIDTLFIAAESSPVGFMLKNGMQRRIDRKRFPRPSISCD